MKITPMIPYLLFLPVLAVTILCAVALLTALHKRPPIATQPKIIEAVEDEPVVIGECSNGDFSSVNALYMAGLTNPRFKWVEARGKKDAPGIIEVVAHTYPDHLPDNVLNGAD